jgi:hypothetical protein
MVRRTRKVADRDAPSEAAEEDAFARAMLRELLALRGGDDARRIQQTWGGDLSTSTVLAAAAVARGLVEVLRTNTKTTEARLKRASAELLDNDYCYGQALLAMVRTVGTRHLLLRRQGDLDVAQGLIRQLARLDPAFRNLAPEAVAKLLPTVKPGTLGAKGLSCSRALASLCVECGAFGARAGGSRRSLRSLTGSFNRAWKQGGWLGPQDIDHGAMAKEMSKLDLTACRAKRGTK